MAQSSLGSNPADSLFSVRADRPLITCKYVQDMEKRWENNKLPGGVGLRCKEFKDDWRRCADGLTFNRAKVECRYELEDMLECVQCNKQYARQKAILQQRDKLIREGKYKAPPFPES